eukprot:6213568-Pleurochrysis_carterae.AAC.5
MQPHAKCGSTPVPSCTCSAVDAHNPSPFPSKTSAAPPSSQETFEQPVNSGDSYWTIGGRPGLRQPHMVTDPRDD